MGDHSPFWAPTRKKVIKQINSWPDNYRGLDQTLELTLNFLTRIFTDNVNGRDIVKGTVPSNNLIIQLEGTLNHQITKTVIITDGTQRNWPVMPINHQVGMKLEINGEICIVLVNISTVSPTMIFKNFLGVINFQWWESPIKFKGFHSQIP